MITNINWKYTSRGPIFQLSPQATQLKEIIMTTTTYPTHAGLERVLTTVEIIRQAFSKMVSNMAKRRRDESNEKELFEAAAADPRIMADLIAASGRADATPIPAWRGLHKFY
jgi:hypothetical protein